MGRCSCLCAMNLLALTESESCCVKMKIFLTKEVYCIVL